VGPQLAAHHRRRLAYQLIHLQSLLVTAQPG
jgi:hypothetical protein